MEKIKVLQVNKLYYPEVGGIEKTLQLLSEGLSKYNELEVLVCQRKGEGVTEFVHGVKVYRAGSFGVIASVPISFSFILKFRRLTKDKDIVHLHLPFPLGDLACLLSGFKGKVIVYWHSDVVKQKGWMLFYRPIMKLFLKRVDMILVGAMGIATGSRYLQPYLDKCREVPFAVEDYILESGRRFIKEHGYIRHERGLHFLFVGRLVYYKGCSILIEAFARMNGNAKLILVGNGALESKLKAQCEKLGIANKVYFAGNVSKGVLLSYFESADVFVLPSIERSEAFALVQLEAMSYGIPVINTNLASGVPEVSIHRQTGLTVEPNDIVQLKEAMEWMECHTKERIEMGMAARSRVDRYYTAKTMISNVQKIYDDIIKDN